MIEMQLLLRNIIVIHDKQLFCKTKAFFGISQSALHYKVLVNNITELLYSDQVMDVSPLEQLSKAKLS